MILKFKRTNAFFGDKRMGFMHSHKGGAPVLRGESSWKTINGIYFNWIGHGYGYGYFIFRRKAA